MKEQFAMAKKHPLIYDVAEEIEELWKKYGWPDAHSDNCGMSTGVHGTVPQFIDEDENFFEYTPENEIEFLVQEYNNALEMLLELTGIWNVGGNTWHTYYYKSADRQDYEEEASRVALDFIHSTMWDRFCNMV